jgi:hypothetical protein
MSIIVIILALIIIGVLLYLVNTKIPMEPTIKLIINIVVIIIVIVWLLKVFGLFDYLTADPKFR